MLDKATMESETTTFTGDGGFALHGINGQIVFPVLVLILFVLSFFAKVPRGVMWAGVALGLTVCRSCSPCSATGCRSSGCCTAATRC